MIVKNNLNILPCANCGSKANLHNQTMMGDGGFYIECENPLCGMTTQLRFSVMDDVEPLLVEIWNRRNK